MSTPSDTAPGRPPSEARFPASSRPWLEDLPALAFLCHYFAQTARGNKISTIYETGSSFSSLNHSNFFHCVKYTFCIVIEIFATTS